MLLLDGVLNIGFLGLVIPLIVILGEVGRLGTGIVFKGVDDKIVDFRLSTMMEFAVTWVGVSITWTVRDQNEPE